MRLTLRYRTIITTKTQLFVALGEVDLQYWMERSMNISGYLDRIGYGDDWEQMSDEV